MGPLINERASREDLIARIETLESTIAELVTDKHIDRRNIEIMINANTALERSNEVQAKRIENFRSQHQGKHCRFLDDGDLPT
mgnify:CR=1 FL=1